MSDEKDDQMGILRDAPFDLFRGGIDQINGVDATGMMSNLRKTPAERLRYNTVAAINIARLRTATRRK